MAFGGPPSTPAFGGGSFGGFGQNNQASGGGLFGSKPQATPSLFGTSTPSAFGSSAPQQTNAFGTPSFGGGGASTSTGAGSLFSSTPAKPAASFTFGSSTPAATPAQTGGFGGGSTAFGTSTPSAFGGGGFGAGALTASQPQAVPQNGTASMKTAFAPVQEKDAKDKFIDKPTHAWYHIGYMDEFKNASPEELRWQDYQQGRKDRLKQPLDAAPTGGFGASTGLFGSQGAGGFGSPAGGAFGQKPAGTGFGTPTSGGLFGQQSQPQQQSNPFAPQQNNSPFGAQNTSQPSTSFGGGFGQASTSQSPFGANKPAFGAPATNNAFGSPQNNTTGGFGSGGGFSFGNKPATSSPSLFGGAATSQPASTFGQQSTTPFGQSTSQPQQTGGFSFGSNTTNTQPFGQTANNSPFGGQQQQQQQPQTGGFSFGNANSNTQTNQSPFGGGGNTSFGGFGQQQQPQQQQQQSTGAFGSLGGSTSVPQFGAGNTSTANTGSLFGQPQQQQQNQQQGTSLFGGGQQNNTNTGGSLFGGGGGFGQSNQQSQAQPSGGLFSFGKPATNTGTTGGGGSLFGNTGQQSTGGSLFGGGLGQSQQNQQGNQNTGSLFGGGGAGGSLFGKPNPAPTQPQGGGLFGSSNFGQSQNTGGFGQSQQGQPPNLNTTPYGASPLFSSVQPKQNAAPFAPDVSTNDKALFSRSPVPGPRAQNTPKNINKITRIRFMTPSASTSALNERSGSPSLGDVNFGPGTFSARSNIKRLELDRKGSLGDLRSKSASLPPSAAGTPKSSSIGHDRPGGTSSKGLSIDPATDAAASPGQLNITLRLRKDGEAGNGTHTPPPLPRTLNPSKARRSPTVGGAEQPDNSTAESSEYVCTPRIAELERFSPSELARVENLKIEKPGYGSLTWLEPVDLTGLESLDDLVGGRLVQIDGSGVELYQDMEYPAPGSELNKPALVSIENVWPKNRSTGQRGPTTDEDALAHHRKELKKRLKKFQGDFVEYDDKSGRWTFKVPFFWDGKRKT